MAMKLNLIIGFSFIVLAGVLLTLSLTNRLGNGWLGQADKVASIVSFVIAVVAFINPFSGVEKSGSQNVTIGDGNRQVQVGQSQNGDVTFGDTSTSAERRADNAADQIKAENLRNFSELAVLIQTIEGMPPEPFWDKRRTNETELAYQDRAANYFRDYVSGVNDQIKLLKFSTSVYDAYQRDLAHNGQTARRTQQVYDAQIEAVDSFNRLRSGLQNRAGSTQSDVERTEAVRVLHQEMLANSKMMLSQAAAHFSLVADTDEMNRLADSFSVIGIDANWKMGQDGYRTGMELASAFNKARMAVLRGSIESKVSGTEREISRRINDPYLIRIRELAGLPKDLTREELWRLQNTEINRTEQDPLELFKLANFSYAEMDGAASILYFQRALETNQLSPAQAKYARSSIHRIQNPDFYEGSLGVMLVNLQGGSNFAQAGLAVGDVIVSIDGQTVNEPLEIASALAQTSNERLVFKVIRGDEKLTVQVSSRQSGGAALSQLILLNAVQV